MTPNRRSVARAGGLALLVSVVLLSGVSPASAHGSGNTNAGGSNIHAEADPVDPLCIEASTEDDTSTRIVLFSTGTFNDSQVSVPHRTVFTTTETYYFGPGGTYSDASCTVEYAVPGTLVVEGGGSSVSCTSTSATYERRGSTYTITTTSPTTCRLSSLSPTHTANLTYTGTQLACTFDPTAVCLPNNTGNEFTGTYSQT